MYLNSHIASECCGCTACEQICPKKCISMQKNPEGFLYPIVDEINCVKCGLCNKVCPIENHQRKEQEDICYYGWHKNEEIRNLSTSGAAFIGIAQVCKKNRFKHFYGAAYNDSLQVQHIDVPDFKNPELLRCSKYTQSDMTNVYSEVKRNLLKGEKVLFSGTPCQVEGLKRFLGKYNEQDLMLIALVCHGVSSPVAFARYLQEVEKDNNSSVLGVRFRDKRISNGTLSHRFTTLTLKDGREISSTDDLYTAAFGIGVMDRESCYCCPYASPSGAGDVTIGDFWGIEKTVPHLSSEISKGISLIIPHTEKAVNLMTELSEFMLLEKIPLKSAVNDRQRQLQMPIERPKMRDTFLQSVLVEHRKFKREAQNAVLVWKINGYKKRAVNKLNKVFGRNKVKS